MVPSGRGSAEVASLVRVHLASHITVDRYKRKEGIMTYRHDVTTQLSGDSDVTMSVMRVFVSFILFGC